MIGNLREIVSVSRSLVREVDREPVSPRDAAELVELFAELERVANAGRTLAGRRVESSKLWLEQGYRSPAQWMASRAQTTVGAAIATLETGRRLEDLPSTRDVFKEGALSAFQAAEISAAGEADPSAEASLLRLAARESVADLRNRCRQVIAASSRDDDRDEWIHRSRYLRHWLEADGAFRLDARLTADAGARLLAVVQARGRLLRDQARRAGSKERAAAYEADALVSLAEAAAPGPRAVVHVHVDEAAWTRGRARRGEACRIAGLGPVSVSAARRLAEEGIVKAVVTDGVDVRAVSHLGRTIPARLRTALEARDVTCVVPECDEREGLEIDHIVPLGDGGPTRLDNLCRLCHFHHALKTHRGWQVRGGPGRWEWVKPTRAAARPPPE